MQVFKHHTLEITFALYQRVTALQTVKLARCRLSELCHRAQLGMSMLTVWSYTGQLHLLAEVLTDDLGHSQ